MAQTDQQVERSIGLPVVDIPEDEPPTEEQLARWKKAVAEAHRIQAEIGPVDIRADDLLHLARSESSA